MTVATTTPKTILDDHPAIDVLRADLDANTKADLGQIELGVLTSYTLADAMREGSSVTEQAIGGFRKGDQVCALSAAYLAARARDYV